MIKIDLRVVLNGQQSNFLLELELTLITRVILNHLNQFNALHASLNKHWFLLDDANQHASAFLAKKRQNIKMQTVSWSHYYLIATQHLPQQTHISYLQISSQMSLNKPKLSKKLPKFDNQRQTDLPFIWIYTLLVHSLYFSYIKLQEDRHCSHSSFLIILCRLSCSKRRFVKIK